MAMSKKDYELIATTLGRVKASVIQDGAFEPGITLATDNLAQALRETNARFDPNRFREWVDEVARGERDEWTGRKVKPTRCTLDSPAA